MSAVFSDIPSTAQSCSGVALRMADIVLKCFSRALALEGPMPGISVRVLEREEDFLRVRWKLTAKR